MADRPQTFERATALVLFLTKRSTPASLEEIRRAFPGTYAHGESGRKMFLRDKKELAEWGYPVEERDDRYFIDERKVYVPDLFLEDTERAALHAALRSARASQGILSAVAPAFGGFGDLASSAASVQTDLHIAGVVQRLYEAVGERRLVKARYKGTERTLEPWGLLCRRGGWYLHALDRGDSTAKNLRVERFESGVATAGDAGAFEPPADLDLSKVLPQGWEIPSEDTYDVVVRVSPALARRARSEVTASAEIEEHDDGSIVVRMTVSHLGAFQSWLFSYHEHAEVVGPDEVRSYVIESLRRMVGGGAS
jgi:proteasome accessory factor B